MAQLSETAPPTMNTNGGGVGGGSGTSGGALVTIRTGDGGSGQHLSVSVVPRPRSLQIGPEKEPINFNVNLVGAPPEVEQLVEHIKAVAEQFLYRWKTFPLNLPAPVSSGHVASGNGNDSTRKYRPLNLADLFVAPMFDELDAVATDGAGELKRLSGAQLKTIREQGLHKDVKLGKQKKLSAQQLESIQMTGEFEVASLHFPGQMHRWRLSQLLQKGQQRAHNALLDDLALAARLMIVTARARLSGNFFSVTQALHALAAGLLRLLDITVGAPSLLAHNLDYKIREERIRYLVAELVCRPEYELCMDTLCAYVRRELRRATTEKFDVDCDLAPPVPYRFLTPSNLDIDLRLFSRDLMRRALPTLIGILERETRGWFLHFRERLIAEMRDKKMTDSEIEHAVNAAVMREYLQRVYASILGNEELAALGDGIPQLLVHQAQAVVHMHTAIETTQRQLRAQRHDHERLLRNDYPILSRVRPWLRAQLRKAAASAAIAAVATWAAHEEAIRQCGKHNLPQAVYFLSRDLAFMREREPVLLKELRNAKTPTRTFQWSVRIWSPRRWLIRRNFQGQSELIPTVICQQATSIVTPRSDPSQPVFLVQRETLRTTSTRWPLWRLVNMAMRVWCWTWNMMFVLGVCVPLYSPVGVRALFGTRPFMPDLELSQVNGTLFPRKSSVTPTLASRLIELWRGISKSRTHFESQPDTGFIGKSWTRHANRVWNYGAKGMLGTLAIVFGMPVVCVAVSVIGVLLALSAPLWVPMATVLLHVFHLLVVDADCAIDAETAEREAAGGGQRVGARRRCTNRYCVLLHALVWTLCIEGVAQMLAAVVMATVVCPVMALLVCAVGAVRYGVRLVWDAFVYHACIKKCGRVPARDGCAVRRVAGPGMADDYWFVIRPEQALAAFEAKMELDELQAYQQRVEREIAQPQRDFGQFVEACFGVFSAQLAKTGAYRALERESIDLQTVLREKLEKRRQELRMGLSGSVMAKIKLDTMDLKIALQQGAHLLEKFYPEHVFGRTSINEEEFWESKGLHPNDWAGLAGHLYTEMFSHDFLTPLAETDTKFRLDAHRLLDLSRYTEMVLAASELMGVNGPDLLGNVYAPRGNIHVHSPYLEISAFNPRSKMTVNFRKADKRTDTKTGLTTPRVHAKRQAANGERDAKHSKQKKSAGGCAALGSSTDGGGGGGNGAFYMSLPWRPWKRKCADTEAGEKLLIPLPIPHPAHIAIAVHNRDAEQPIQLDSELCWDILRAIEDCQGDVKAANVAARFRGGNASTSTEDEEDSSGRPGAGAAAAAAASLDSVDDLSESNSNDSDRSTDRSATSSARSGNDSAGSSIADGAIGGGTETLPCGGATSYAVATTVRQTPPPDGAGAGGANSSAGGGGGGFHWTLSNWGAATQATRRRTNAAAGAGGQVRVDLASPEDISLDTDTSTRTGGFNAYGTTV